MDFQGLQNSIPVFVLVALFSLIAFASWYSYRKYSSIPSLSRYTLIALRVTSLLIVAVLLLNPYFRKTEEVTIKPKFAVLLDNSESTSVQKGSYSGAESYKRLINSLKSNAPNNIELDFLGFSSGIKSMDPDSLSFKGSLTNLFEAVGFISSSEENYHSAVLVTDGIITYGKNPSIQALNSPIPIHTIGIGDTTRVKDIALQNLTVNETGFTNTRHTLEAEISHFGFQGQPVSIFLSNENQVIDSIRVLLDNPEILTPVGFEIPLSDTGLKTFSIEVEPLEQEWTTKNNQLLFSVDVLDSKTRVLHVAGSVHPDVKTIRTILSENENIELSTITYLGINSPYEDMQASSQNFDLAIIHGTPGTTFIENILSELGEIPTLYIDLPASDLFSVPRQLSLIDEIGSNSFEVALSIPERNSNHPILELSDIEFPSLPRLFSNIRTTLSQPDVVSIIESEFQGVPTNSTVLGVIERGNIRRSHVQGFNWFAIYQDNPASKAFVEELFTNIVNWTATNPDNRLLKIKPSRVRFSVAEPPVINASLINESGEVEANANIDVFIESDSFSSSFSMKNLGKGSYRLESPPLPSGSYSFTATAKKGNRDIETQTGEFVILDSSLELANTTRNDGLLNSIAQGSKGMSFSFDEADGFWSSVTENSNLESRTEIRESYLFPVRSPLWFILVLLLLGSEWLLRKKYTLP